MRKILLSMISTALVLSLSACSNTNQDSSLNSNSENSSQTAETNTNINSSDILVVNSIDEIEEMATSDITATVNTLRTAYDQLAAEINTYDKYVENVDQIESFYNQVIQTNQLLCIRMREYALNYATLIVESDSSNDDKYDDLDMIFDVIYDDGSDEIYDEIYDSLTEDMYDTYYDGILDDAYDTVDYSEWFDYRSDEYEFWFDTRSDLYDQWYDLRSDVYDFWSDLRSALWNDDIEKANEIISDFKEDINTLKTDE